MVRCPKFAIFVSALITLLALKIYMESTYEVPLLSDPLSSPINPPSDPLKLLEPLRARKDLSLLALHDLAQRLRGAVAESDAYWNQEELQLLSTGDPRAWTCGATGPPLKDPAAFPDLLQRFLLHGGCRNHRLLIDQPDKCPTNRTYLLLAVKSSPQNFAQRQAVRDSWGAERDYAGLPVRLVFLLGTAQGPDLSALLHYEGSRSRDILQWDFQDTFFNLTLKDQLFLGWARLRCPGASFVFKGDDDVFARTPAILRYLSSLSLRQSHALYMGHVVMSATPFRDPRSKYYIPPSYYTGSYPPYAGGGGYVFSGSLTPWLYLVSHFVVPFPIDDVYTGMCFMALGVRPRGHPGFQTFEAPGKDTQSGCSSHSLLLVHRKTPQQILRLWGELRDPTSQC
ncbi:hypothetical protein FKM82_016158 [Ascaphus truei]